METLGLIIGVSLIILLFLSGGLAVIVVSQQTSVSEANALGRAVLDHFKKVGKKCDARYKEFPAIQACVQELTQELGVIGELKEEAFVNVNLKKNETGFIVLENKGRIKLNSSRFALYKNHELADQGCVIEGTIDPGYLCRLEFNTSCEKGDVLEAMHEEKRAFLKTC